MRLRCAHPSHQDRLILTLSSMFTVPNLFGAWHRSGPVLGLFAVLGLDLRTLVTSTFLCHSSPCQVCYSRLTSLLSCSKHKWYSALEPFLGALIEYRTFPLLLKGRLLLGSTNFRVFVLQKLNPRVLWHSVTNCDSSRHSRPPDTALLVGSILLLSPSHSHQWHCFRSSSPDLKFNQAQVVLPFCLSHTESLWLTLTHSAAHYSSPLGITNPHYSPYQSLTNHAYYAAYQFLTHAPMLPMHDVITYAHLALIYSSRAQLCEHRPALASPAFTGKCACWMTQFCKGWCNGPTFYLI